jgi:hypothetical protein
MERTQEQPALDFIPPSHREDFVAFLTDLFEQIREQGEYDCVCNENCELDHIADLYECNKKIEEGKSLCEELQTHLIDKNGRMYDKATEAYYCFDFVYDRIP